MGMGEGNMEVVNINPPHLSGSQYGGNNRSLNYPSGLYIRASVPTQERQNSIQHVNSFSIERDGAFRHDCVKRKHIELHTRYICYIQELNLDTAVLTVHYHQ